ncbi:InlB B-repeat-containing protein [Phosphitispora fastidiosa]|uniref:InlB B-repeat-containing protein n=1 Tax=Phosphitispora fastidiosa TaxID=2837202 RepID=UPI001E58D882|nr:InlB B-repeat-containing protein [Phosphitispora fastidiosa]MBU7005971.1 putative repeat protein (TIGR02543 family) [Phosphitispora fastidiosa]
MNYYKRSLEIYGKFFFGCLALVIAVLTFLPVQVSAAEIYDVDILLNGNCANGFNNWEGDTGSFISDTSANLGLDPSPDATDPAGWCFTFYPGAAAAASLSQTVSLTDYAVNISNGAVNLELSGYVSRYKAVSANKIRIQLLDNSGVLISGEEYETVGSTADTDVSWEQKTINISSIHPNTRSVKVILEATINVSPDVIADYIQYDGIQLKLHEVPTYTVTYDGNSNTGGAVPTDATSYHNGDTATVMGNTGSLVRTGYTFAGWNTAANGSGTSYTGGDTFAIGTSNVTLYAQWTVVDYTVTYNGNTNTGGSVPTDGNTYNITDTVTVLGNTGSLVKAGYTFAGWNTAANGSGTSYTGGDTFAMGSSNVTLYAQWTENTYTVTYDGNSNTGGAVPTDATSYHNGDTATVLGNTGSLVRTGYTFAGWNTAANGSGTSYTGGDTFAIGTSNVTLYAQWTAVDYTVTYNGNTNTGGSVPTDGNTYNITDTVIVLGNTGSLVKTGYTFAGWNTAANGSGTSYTGGDTFAMGSSNVTLYAQWTENTYTVTYDGNSNTGGAVPTDATSYHNGDTATVLGNTGSLVRTGYAFAGWNTAANGSGTSYTGGDTFAMGSSNVTLYAQWRKNSSGGSTTPTPTIDTKTEVVVDGQVELAGTTTNELVNGETVTTVTVDESILEKILNTEGSNITVQIPISGNSDVNVGELTGKVIKTMETKGAVLEIQTQTVKYTIPASEINIDNVLAELGGEVEHKDVKISIKIAQSPKDTVRIIEDTANKNNYQIVVKPIDFQITSSSGEKTVNVSEFNGFVERTVAIPDGIDPSKITTGIVLNEDGTFSHVPTQVIVIDGKCYAKINSLTNSTYGVIWNPREFIDVRDHWAKDAVNDMGSRLVIGGIGNDMFAPDRDITRAEFAAIIVRALGLKPGTENNPFTDIKTADWYYEHVQIAYEYGIVSGFGNSKFGPMDKITREQAMTMIFRAMNITGLKVEIIDETESVLAEYVDGTTAANWAKESIAACVKTQIVSGKNGSIIAPRENITRAEVAIMVSRLLQKSNLI